MRYPGGKGKCYQHLINLMPPHDTYIESHLGGGAVLRNKKPAKRSIGIDKNPEVISIWQNHYPGLCELVQTDASEYLIQHRYTGNELVYADPPYLASTRRRSRVYPCDYNSHDHARLLEVIKSLSCMVMVSGYDSELYNDLLSDWHKVTFTAKTHTDARQECVWINFEPPRQLHDAKFLGTNFRERQTIKRRGLRLREKISRMNEIERNELMRWLATTYAMATLEGQ